MDQARPLGAAQAPEKLNHHQRLALADIQKINAKLYRAYLLKE
jgi:hypothetical protein